MKRRLLLFLIFFLSLSCEKILLPENPSTKPETQFEIVWQTLYERYSLFELKKIDWLAVRDSMKPKISNQMGSIELFDVLSDMLFILKDGHTNLISGFDIGRNWNWYLNYPQNFDYSVVERHYLLENHRITGPFKHQLIDSVGYVYYGSFGSNFSESQLDLVLKTYEPYKGLILDVRDNGGGSLTLAKTLGSTFVQSKTLGFYEITKTGPNPDAFSNPQPYYIDPRNYFYPKPLVILTNRSCYSATNSLIAMLKGLPNITIIGDTTGGGGGLPVSSELPNGWTFRYSASRTIDRNGHEMELGIAPDYALNLSIIDLQNGRDTFIEKALSCFN